MSNSFTKYELIFLTQVKGIALKRIDSIRSKCDSFDCLKNWTVFDWKQIKGIRPQEIHQDFHLKLNDSSIHKRIEQSLSYADHCISFWDSDYPPLLKQIFNPPVILFCKGNKEILHSKSLAIVGSRSISSYGREISRQISQELSKNDLCIVSGFASGVDTIAHQETLRNGGKTIAVLGCGLNLIYPKSNAKLYRDILDNDGLILSEYLFNAKPDAVNFPKRNRIIAGLSKAIIVTEAGRKSGALITAEMALEEGRDVFAVPGPINSEQSKGTNYLIQQGAYLYQSIEDIKEHLKLQFQTHIDKEKKHSSSQLSGVERTLFELISKGDIHVDELQVQSKLPVQELLFHLLQLELMGEIQQLANKNYSIT